MPPAQMVSRGSTGRLAGSRSRARRGWAGNRTKRSISQTNQELLNPFLSLTVKQHWPHVLHKVPTWLLWNRGLRRDCLFFIVSGIRTAGLEQSFQIRSYIELAFHWREIQRNTRVCIRAAWPLARSRLGSRRRRLAQRGSQTTRRDGLAAKR